MSSKVLYIDCTIERGGFSNERTFEIDAGNGELLVGTAHVQYLRDQNKTALDDDTPGYSEKINGYVACKVIEKSLDGSIRVELPSSDVIHVPSEHVSDLVS